MRVLSLAVALVVGIVAQGHAADPTYKIVDRIKMPDGGWDYGSIDAAARKVYWTRTEFTDVIDLKTGSLSQIKSAAHGHVAVAVPGTSLLVLPKSVPTNAVLIVDGAKDALVAELPVGVFPDGAIYDPASKLVVVANHTSSDVSLVDAAAHAVVGVVHVGGGKLEFPAVDGTGRAFVNVESTAEIAVIDIAGQKLVGRYKLAGCEGPTGLVYAPQPKVLIASCDNGVAKAIAPDTGKDVASVPIGKGPDSVLLDPVRNLAFVPCGQDGVLDILAVGDAANIHAVQRLQTHVLARTGAVDPETGRVYLMSAEPDPSKPKGGGGRPTPKDGSFEVLVVGPG